MPPPTEAAPFLTVAFFVVVAVLLGVELLLGADDVLLDEDELGVEELGGRRARGGELDGGLFANPVEFVDGCVVVAGFLAFFAFFLVASAETNALLAVIRRGRPRDRLRLADRRHVRRPWLSRLADVVGAGESDRRSGASAR